MNQKLPIIFSLIFFLTLRCLSQTETYKVEKAPFSSDKYDEFCPVFYKNGIVFTTNRSKNSLSDYSGPEDKGQFKIYYTDTTGRVTWQQSRLFSKDLSTRMNDGPVTFNKAGDTIYFVRNLQVEGSLKDLQGQRNKLGIFSATFDGKNWTKIREFRFNNEWYNVSTPWLSSDGKRLFFASDKTGGFGGSDLYYSDWKNGYWTDPVNLGPVINTPGNESYPYINPAGELFFSSDGHKGLGKKDIFFSRNRDGNWLPPVDLDPPINSQFDDFGIVTDSLINQGYFSSDRDRSIDIYRFKTNIPQIFYTDIQKENHYCFIFSDSGAIEVDTLILKYVWDFGDGQKANGATAKHCYSGPGKYQVRLDLYDRATGKLFFTKLSYILELKDYEQPFINSPVAAITGEQVDFDGLSSYLPGYKVISYSWEFGEDSRLQGERVRYSFKKSGEYNINLGLKVQSLTTRAIHNTGVTKKIIVFTDKKERDSFNAKAARSKDVSVDIRKYENAVITPGYSAEDDFKKPSLFYLEIYSSVNRTGAGSQLFKNVPGKYSIREVNDSDANIYRYVAEEQLNLMWIYPAFKELSNMAFKDFKVRLLVVKDQAEKELVTLKRNYGVQADTYFDANNRLTSTGYLLLDQIVILMNRYPTIRLEIGVHTDNLGLAANNLTLSQTRVQVMVNYLIDRGINAKRLIGKGYGGVKPIAPNMLENDRRLNRRIDVMIID